MRDTTRAASGSDPGHRTVAGPSGWVRSITRRMQGDRTRISRSSVHRHIVRARCPRSRASNRSRRPVLCAGRSTTASRARWRASASARCCSSRSAGGGSWGWSWTWATTPRSRARSWSSRSPRSKPAFRPSWSSWGCGWPTPTARRPRADWRSCCRRAPARRRTRRPGASTRELHEAALTPAGREALRGRRRRSASGRSSTRRSAASCAGPRRPRSSTSRTAP